MDNEEKLNDALPEDKASKSQDMSDSCPENQEETNVKPVVPSTDVPQEEPSEKQGSNSNPTSKPNKFISFFKSKTGICTIAAILVVGILSFVFIKKYINEKNYEKNLKEFIIESGKASIASSYICDDLRKIWQEYIFDDKEYFDSTTGTFGTYSSYGNEYCSDFSEAVHRKIQWNDENLSNNLKEPYRTAKRIYKEMTPPPGKYKEIHTYVKQMFKAMERLHDLSENPTGNLSSFSSECNEAVNEYSSALSDLTTETDIDLSEKDDD